MSRKTREIAQAALDLVQGYREVDKLVAEREEHPGRAHYEAATKKLHDGGMAEIWWNSEVLAQAAIKAVPEVHKFKVHEYLQLMKRYNVQLAELRAAKDTLYKYS